MNRKNTFALTALLTIISFVISGCAFSSHAKQYLSFRRTENSIALLNDSNNIIWQLNFDKKYDKPFFHPVALADGTVLTECRPKDHPWHRGLWWSWKFLNGLNYWEDDPNTWIAPGRNEIVQTDYTQLIDGSTLVKLTVSYHPPDKPEVLSEVRILKISPINADGGYRIDWTSAFTAADEDVLFDRTPIIGDPCGVVWGGYAGLSVRLVRDSKNCQIVDSEGHTYNKEFNNAKAKWLDYTFEVAGKPAGIAILDHPSNLRHPTPWYVIITKDMRYFSPAFIYYEPYTLKAHQSLTLKYRIIIHPGRTDSASMEKQWTEFSK